MSSSDVGVSECYQKFSKFPVHDETESTNKVAMTNVPTGSRESPGTFGNQRGSANNGESIQNSLKHGQLTIKRRIPGNLRARTSLSAGTIPPLIMAKHPRRAAIILKISPFAACKQ